MADLLIRRAHRVMIGPGPNRPPSVLEAWGTLGPGYAEGTVIDDAHAEALWRAKNQWPEARAIVIDRVQKGLILKSTWQQVWVDGVLKLEAPYVAQNPLGALLTALGQLLGL